MCPSSKFRFNDDDYFFLRLSLTLAENKETPVTKNNDDDNDDDDNDDDSDACNDDNGDSTRILPAFDF